MNPPFTYLITTGEAEPATFSDLKPQILRSIELAVECGISFVQIREKRITAKQLFELTKAASLITSDTATILMVNGRADIATAAGADGVHLPETGLPVDVIKKAFPGLVVGASVHSIEAAKQARSDGADHIIFGNVFATPGKGEPVGLSGLNDMCNAVDPLPVIAVGGIGLGEIRDVINAGAAGFAAIRMFTDESRLKLAIEKTREIEQPKKYD